MIKAGCRPGVNYYRWSEDVLKDDGYQERDDIIGELEYLMLEHLEPTPWEDISEDCLVKYLGVVRGQGRGR